MVQSGGSFVERWLDARRWRLWRLASRRAPFFRRVFWRETIGNRFGNFWLWEIYIFSPFIVLWKNPISIWSGASIQFQESSGQTCSQLSCEATTMYFWQFEASLLFLTLEGMIIWHVKYLQAYSLYLLGLILILLVVLPLCLVASNLMGFNRCCLWRNVLLTSRTITPFSSPESIIQLEKHFLTCNICDAWIHQYC